MPKIEVRISDPFSFSADTIGVFIIMKHDETTRSLMHMTEGGLVTWTPLDYPAVVSEPTIVLQNDIALILRDALNARYQGTADVTTVRADLMHERKRVDDANERVMRLALVIGDVAEKLSEQ